MQSLYPSWRTVLGSSLLNLYKMNNLQGVIRPGFETYFAEQLQQEFQRYLFWLDNSIAFPIHCLRDNRIAMTCSKRGTKLLNHIAVEIMIQSRFHGNEVRESKEYWSKEGYQYITWIAINSAFDFRLYICPSHGLDIIVMNKKRVEKLLSFDEQGKNLNDFYDLDFFTKDRERIIELSNKIVEMDQQDNK